MVYLFRMLRALAKNDLGLSSGMDSQRGGGGGGGRVVCLSSAGTVRLAFTAAAHVAYVASVRSTVVCQSTLGDGPSRSASRFVRMNRSS